MLLKLRYNQHLSASGKNNLLQSQCPNKHLLKYFFEEELQSVVMKREFNFYPYHTFFPIVILQT